jgi:excisionase family DNA binding protein
VERLLEVSQTKAAGRSQVAALTGYERRDLEAKIEISSHGKSMPQLQKKDIGKSSPLPDLVSAEELAKEYEVVVPTVYKWVNKRLIPVWKINSRLFRFDRQEVREALRRSHVPAKEVR